MVLTYAKCQNLITKGRSGRKKLDNNTYLFKSVMGDYFVVSLHDNSILNIYHDDSVIVSSCGWKTKTTKDRLNKYTGLGIYQRQGEWFLSSGLPFMDDMKVESNQYRQLSEPVRLVKNRFHFETPVNQSLDND